METHQQIVNGSTPTSDPEIETGKNGSSGERRGLSSTNPNHVRSTIAISWRSTNLQQTTLVQGESPHESSAESSTSSNHVHSKIVKSRRSTNHQRKSSDESSAESSTNPNHVRSTIAKSRRSTCLQQTISKGDEDAAGHYSRPKKLQRLRSQPTSPIGYQSMTSWTGGTSTNSDQSDQSVNCLIGDAKFLRERRFICAGRREPVLNHIYAFRVSHLLALVPFQGTSIGSLI